jgi:hypothetical protein
MPAVRDGEPAEPEAGATASIDVQFSDAALPTAPGPSPRVRARTVPGRIADSLGQLPVVKEVVPKTRRARVMVRSVIVAFALIGSWIGGIVYLQLRAGERPDFRPEVEALMVAIRDGRATEVYDESSTRFQETVLEDSFLAQMAEMNAILGPFREVASVQDTRMYQGPSGRIARIGVLLDFEKGRVRGSVSFHRERAAWRLLGYHLDLPDELAALATTRERREERVQPPPELLERLRALADDILTRSAEGKAGSVWDAAARHFQDSIDRDDFIALEHRQQVNLGTYLRILNVTEARLSPSQTSASLTALIEYRRGEIESVTTPGSFKFAKEGGDWKMTYYKVISPIPRGAALEPSDG